MQVYLYAKSGHTIGLEQTKQCAAIAHYLQDLTPILCTSDFRAGAFAKDLLGVKKYVNIDVIRNLHNIMNRRDILLYNSDETNELMDEGMNEFCSIALDIDKFENPIVDTLIYNKQENQNIEKAIFFGDDDYYNQFIGLVENSNKYDIELLMGHYFFLGNERIFSEHFSNVIDEEEYVETILNSKYLLTASLQTALESISSGNKPVLFKREDKTYDEELIGKLNIPVVEGKNLDEIIKNFENTIENYPKLNELKLENLENIKINIEEKIEYFRKLLDA